MPEQEQFLEVVDRDEAERRFQSSFQMRQLSSERIPIEQSLQRVLAKAVIAQVDVPAFDRSNFDGYAVRASDTIGASERTPITLRLAAGAIEAGQAPMIEVATGTAIAIATGGMLPRGADAVLMVEHSEEQADQLIVQKSVAAGHGIAFAGTDISLGETVLQAGTFLTSRETGVLAAIGQATVEVVRRPRIAILSTGNEIIAPGTPMRPAAVYDSNAQVLAHAVEEMGGLADFRGIVRDEADGLRAALRSALIDADMVLLSGGTSKGQGDVCYRVIAELNDPGIVVHGVALKPGKPICMAVTGGKPVIVLPGFPTSAVFTFHEFVAPVIRMLAGRSIEATETVSATMATRVLSEIGRTEYFLVGLVDADQGPKAFSMGKGSGSITAFSRADGFVTIPRQTEIIEAGEVVSVTLLGRGLRWADLVVIGSHCAGLDRIIERLSQQRVAVKSMYVGSTAGWNAACRGECDLAGVHLLDPATGLYNTPFVDERLEWIEGYGRWQGIVFRPGDDRFEGRTMEEVRELVRHDESLVMVNRNAGSGTRILIDQLLDHARPAGFPMQPNNHSAVAAAVLQRRADWGVAIEAIAKANGLGFIPWQLEQFDFVIPKSRMDRPAIQAFLNLLRDASVRSQLRSMGLIAED